MKIVKRESMQGDWAKVGEDIVDGGSIVILNEGKKIEGEFGPRVVFKIKTKNGEKNMAFNQTSLNNLVDAYGDDSAKWVNKIAKTYVVKQRVKDKLTNVAYICGAEWEMLDDGTFIKSSHKSPQNAKYEATGDSEAVSLDELF